MATRYEELEKERQEYCKRLEKVDIQAASKHIWGNAGNDPEFAKYAEEQAAEMFEVSEKLKAMKEELRQLSAIRTS